MFATGVPAGDFFMSSDPAHKFTDQQRDRQAMDDSTEGYEYSTLECPTQGGHTYGSADCCR
ncbi:hypothetical protein KDA_76600 [Dictyobacter alpinus]|uniref:Uncharacterized protein n=1 Tax=Dictyobacter alpinus TaxID=2014873 RepID=A0A402BLH1_9CHLR|nr:hypothetical protein [Dictyobacter alpinus]GCE32176.1 hypothetical protein KDA_76600 [Dictyobacter alpinus]